MTIGQALILGIVEGVTEYLPVSSTGHLLLAQRAMGIDGQTSGGAPANNGSSKEAADAYAICIQAGAIIAVLGLYMKHVKQMIMGVLGKDRTGLKMAINIVAAFLPAALIGLLLHKTIKEYLFGPWPVVAAWLVGGIAILAVAKSPMGDRKYSRNAKSLTDMNVRMALIIGLAQCIAMWPGVSRSLITIVGGMLVGLSMSAAVEFSFLLGVVTLGAATIFDALKHGAAMIQTFTPLSLLVGLVAAFLSAVVSVKWMVSYLNRNGLEIFGYYRIAVAAVAAALILTEIL